MLQKHTAKKLRIAIATLSFVVGTGVCVSNAQIRPEDFFNSQSVPLEINVTDPEGNHRANEFLVNRSSGTIVGFSLACVTATENKVKVIKKVKDETIEIGPIGSGDNILPLPNSSHGSYLSGYCSNGTRLSVIAVTFKDGAEWRIKRR